MPRGCGCRDTRLSGIAASLSSTSRVERNRWWGSPPGGPHLQLDAVHLARWRGHALARFGHPDAITVLTDALHRLDPTFVRAETALHVDLATTLAASDNRDEARTHADQARILARELGSQRQRRRLHTLAASLR
jgi:hypothetical protein